MTQDYHFRSRLQDDGMGVEHTRCTASAGGLATDPSPATESDGESGTRWLGRARQFLGQQERLDIEDYL